MIIAGFSGVGKTTFCQQNPHAIDVICMPFKYSNFFDVSRKIGADESIKAHEELKLRKDWFLYYYWVIKCLIRYCPEKYIVIPTIGIIMDFLDRDHIPYTVVVPDISLKGEYEERYKKRGNSQGFLDVFIGEWDYWIENLNNRKAEKIVLKGNEFLTDVLDCPGLKENGEQYKNDKLLRLGKENIMKSLTSEHSCFEGREEQDRICGILYNKSICVGDALADYVIVESKQQLRILLERMEGEPEFEPCLALLDKTFDSDGYKYNETVIKGGDLKELLKGSDLK